MQEALAFYSSSAGKKQAQREMIEAQRRLGYELAEASPALSGRERASLDRFRKTPTYAKLEGLPMKIREARETQMAIYQGSQLIAAGCSQAGGLAR